ncbi:MAG: MFS transporter [Promethearchaeota archaeon]
MEEEKDNRNIEKTIGEEASSQEGGSKTKSIYLEENILNTFEMISYNLGNFGISLIIALLSSFILIYIVSIVGLPPLFVGVVYASGQILYGFMSPLFGAISDRIKSERWGKRKPFMLIGTPLLALVYLWFWLLPPCSNFGVLEGNFSTAIQFVFAIILFRILIAFISAPYTAMIPEISREEINRIKTSMWSIILTSAGQGLGMLIPIFFLSSINKEVSEKYLWYYNSNGVGQSIYYDIIKFVLIVIIIFITGMLITIFTIKTTKMNEDISAESQIREYNVIKTLKIPFKDRNALNFFISTTLSMIPMICLNYLAFNFAIYVVKIEGFMYYLLIIVAIISIEASFLFWNGYAEKVGLKKANMTCLKLSVVSFLLMAFLIFDLDKIIIEIYGLTAVGFALFVFIGANIYPGAILSDIIDQAETSLLKSLSGKYMGAFAFLGAIGGAIAMFISSLFMEIFGVENALGYILIFLIFGSGLTLLAIPFYSKIRIVGKKLNNN